HKTVEALAGAAVLREEAGAALPDIASGALPPTPIMRWFSELGGPIDRFHQAMLLQVPADARQEQLTAALQAVLDHHDALRLRVVAAAPGGALAPEVLPCGAVDARGCLRRIDIGGLDDAARRACIAAAAQQAERRLSPAAGIMLQAVWFDAGAETPRRLLLAIHHLAVDGGSWRLLVAGLAAAGAAVARRAAAAPPAPR